MICYLIRHGQDDETVRGGWSSASLTQTGKTQAAKLAGHIAASNLQIKKLYTSDLPRAAETAAAIAFALKLEAFPVPQFRETNNGLLAGMPHETANKTYPGIYWSNLAWNEAYPQGESPCTFYERIKSAWENFCTAITKENINIALVTHSGVINVINSLINGQPYSNKTKGEHIPYASMLPIKF